jgi:hypothetical protein
VNIDELIAQEAQKAQANANVASLVAAESEREAGRRASVDSVRNEKYNPTEGMSTTQKTLAGIGSGMHNVVQGAGNMLGLVDDETVMGRKRLDAPLSDTTAGSAGQFIGETAALAPLGLVGKGAQAAHGAAKGGSLLPTVARLLTRRGAAAGAEGALAGATLATPNQRGQGAATGAVLGTTLNRLAAGVSRVGKEGLAKTTPAAKQLSKLIERSTGREPFIPLGLAADKGAGSISSKAKSYADFISLLPSARDKMSGQVGRLAGDTYETLLNNSFKGGDKGGTVRRVLSQTNDVEKAIDAARATLKHRGPLSKTQQVIADAASGNLKGQFSPKQLLKSSTNVGKRLGTDPSRAPLREEATMIGEVLGQSMGSSNVASRDAYHKLASTVGFLPDSVPGLGDLLASKHLQKFLMGSTNWQHKLRAAAATRSGKAVRQVMTDMRRAASGQVNEQDESWHFKEYKDLSIDDFIGG